MLSYFLPVLLFFGGLLSENYLAFTSHSQKQGVCSAYLIFEPKLFRGMNCVVCMCILRSIFTRPHCQLLTQPVTSAQLLILNGRHLRVILASLFEHTLEVLLGHVFKSLLANNAFLDML